MFTPRNGFVALLLVTTVVTGAFAFSRAAAAQAYSWSEGSIQVDTASSISNQPSEYGRYGDCRSESVQRADSLAPTDACVFRAKSFRYTIYDGALYISVNGDGKFYRVNGAGFSSINYTVPSPESDDVIYGSVVWRDLLSHLTLHESVGIRYYVPHDPYENMTQDDQGNIYSVGTSSVSHNGKWQVLNIAEIGLVRVDMTNMSFTRVAAWTNSYALTAISNDGKYIASVPFSSYQHPAIYTIASCGQSATQMQRSWYNDVSSQNLCEATDLYQPVSSALGKSFTSGYWPDFSDDGGQLKMLASPSSGGNRGVVISAAGYAQTRLDYLALGDSYSSGEGDTERDRATGKKYYRDYTNYEEIVGVQPREKCHISTRSYPYILAKGMALGNPMSDMTTKWQTVACSGAQKNDVTNTSSSYKGQGKGGGEGGKPRLEGYDAASLKSTAFNEFIPGRNAQIEFVKKYKPKVITLTMGGNDVGFGDKIDSCVKAISSCEFTKQSYRQKLKNELRDMYGDLTALYQQLYDASDGQSKIYVLGYPQFISDDPDATCSNTFNLNADERKMIYSSVEYFNNVIEQAAKRVGVKYVDIENALGNRKLCENAGAYVTAITGVLGWNGNDQQESFHPNADGHEAIASAIKLAVNNQSLQTYNWCQSPIVNIKLCPDFSATQDTIPTPSNGYFDEGTPTTTKLKKQQAVDPTVKKTVLVDLKLDKYSGRPGTNFTATLHSDPIELGSLPVDSDGSIDTQITIPGTVPAGFHTLILSGETYSGEPIEYYQSVLVVSSDSADLDENGTPDTQQPCGPFLTSSNQDADLDGIDDACDPEISDTPQLYRVRQGDTTRTYAGSTEKPHYLYVERNTRASGITGITGDNDPDGDGWAIVGASQGVQYTATAVPDTGPAANFVMEGSGANSKPYVYLRAGGWGCASFTPNSLAKVTAGQSRTLKKVAVNTDKCRQESADDDVDGNGQPDNTQLLYEAHQGDSIRGEDPSRIYLYRSFHAAESQLGLSDYTPTGTSANTIAALPLIPTIGNSPNDPIFGKALEPLQPWNLLATSKAGEYIPAFNKLVIIQDENSKPLPIILTKKQNNQCIAYKPQDTGIIKFNQQNTLTKMASVPGGVGCE